MALCNEVKPLQLIPSHLVHHLKPNSPTHLAMSQVDLVERLLKDLGTENSGFTVDNVMKVESQAHLVCLFKVHFVLILKFGLSGSSSPSKGTVSPA